MIFLSTDKENDTKRNDIKSLIAFDENVLDTLYVFKIANIWHVPVTQSLLFNS